MATIGTFKKTANNEFVGDIVTLGVQAKGVRVVPDSNRANDNAPFAPGDGRPGRDRRRLDQAVQRGPRIIWASSSTIRASPPRSTPTSSTMRTARAST